MGSPDFAARSLRAIVDAGHTVAVVYCQPPRPAGRGMHEARCAVHVTADELGLPVRTPLRLRGNTAEFAFLAGLDLDMAVVAAYGLILPREVLEAPRRGCLNIHASLLPRWRGAAPIQAAILAGDAETGITIMQMDEGLDTGPMLLAGALPLGPRATTPEVHDQLAALGSALILRVLAGEGQPVPQPAEGATYAPKIQKADGRLDWRQDAAALARRIRALNPWPGTYFEHAGQTIRVLEVEVWDETGPPGEILAAGPVIGCGQGALRLNRLQRPGRQALPGAEFVRGYPLPPGTLLA